MPALNEISWEPGCCTDRRLGYERACTDDTCMRLPAGKTCGDCVHLTRCKSFGFTAAASEQACSFHPRRFREVPLTPSPRLRPSSTLLSSLPTWGGRSS